MDRASASNVTVWFESSNVVAIGGTDYSETNAQITFSALSTQETFTVKVIGDLIDEGSGEIFHLNLSNAVNATILDATAIVTINDDDAPPQIFIGSRRLPPTLRQDASSSMTSID